MPAQPGTVAGQRILITGAARGIGAEAARQLARRGARLALVGLEPEQLARVAAECGPETIWIQADIADADAITAALASAREKLGGIDAVVANAGIGGGGLVRSMDPLAFDRIIEVNLLGTCRTVRACLPAVTQTRGYILIVASVAAISHLPGMAAYAASKAGVEAFSNALRTEVRHLGIDVGVAYFSWIDTDLVRASDGHAVFAGLRAKLRGPGSRTYPLSRAADAIVAGLERRSRIVVAPGWIRGLLAVRGILPSLVDRRVAPEVPALDARAEAEIGRVGAAAASAPVGPGGAAAMAATAPARSDEPAPR